MCMTGAEKENGSDVPATFAQRERRGGAGTFQAAAMKSILWYESVDERMPLEPVAFAYDYMMRAGRVDHERLRRQNPEFAARVEKLRERA
ncbi:MULTISPECIES: hypothetical protein [unclassified Beijerinckia]|uniref:hypothetical protein n=1 Tax=unclassified Beijerinckia TaxID=2638183 RepID=UPI001114D37D|nr:MULTISPECIES: hypothetical protein [unclassified Beijerinckia]